MLRLFCVCAALLMAGVAPQAVRADEESVAIQRPFLWQVTPPQSEAVSWLFGTIHVSDPQITSLHAQVNDAFQRCAAAWFEIDFAKDAATQTRAISLPQGTRLTDLVSVQTIARIDRRLAAIDPRLSRARLPEFHVIMWPMVLDNLEAQTGHAGKLPMDMLMQQAAQTAGKQTGGLEDATAQLKPLTDLSIEQQSEFLRASLDVMDEDERSGVSRVDSLVRLYCTGDEDLLQQHLMHELQRPQVSEELRTLFMTTLIVQRNQLMSQAIQERIMSAPSDSHFVAVGTAHLIGPQSVVEALRAAGFTVQRVQESSDSNTQ